MNRATTIHELSKRDACTTLELICESLTCTSPDQFRQLIVTLKKLVPFEMATCLISKKNESGRVESLDIVNVNYPAEWVNLYVKNGYQQIDPVLRANFEHFKLQYWSDTYRQSPPPRHFRSIAEDFGLKLGYTHGVRNISGDEGSLFSLSGPSLKQSEHTETILNAVIPHLHQAFCKAVNFNKRKTLPVLSSREKEVLSWMKLGKSSWDISVISHISERTVHFHAQNIMRKLNASSRAHAVAIALAEKMIEPV